MFVLLPLTQPLALTVTQPEPEPGSDSLQQSSTALYTSSTVLYSVNCLT